MLVLVLAMLFCVAVGAVVVGYVMLEARREGRGEFWTPEGEELIAGARRTGEKVRSQGERIGRTAAERTRGLAGKLPEASSRDVRPQTARAEAPGAPASEERTPREAPRRPAPRREPVTDVEDDASEPDAFRAAS